MGIFDKNDSDSTPATCPKSTATDPAQFPIVGNLSFHQLLSIISGACTAFACVLSFYLIFRHATHYSLPKEQKHIIRIIFMIPVFAIISFVSVIWYDGADWLKPIEDVYEAFALASFFLLLCAFVQEDDNERQAFFHTSGTMKQYTAATIGCFQFPVVMLIVLIVTEVTQATGKYCKTSNNVHFAHIWCTILMVISTVVAISSLLRFYKALKPTIHHRKPLPKLIGFKVIVFLSFIQNTIFSFLTSSNKLNPTSHMAFKDLSIGIPNLILCIEMAIISLGFLYIYRTQEYIFKPTAQYAVPLGHGGYQGGFMGFKAYVDAINIVDILQGIISVPGLFLIKRREGRNGKVLVPGTQRYQTIEMMPQHSSTVHAAQPHIHDDGYAQGFGGLGAHQSAGTQLYEPTMPLVHDQDHMSARRGGREVL